MVRLTLAYSENQPALRPKIAVVIPCYNEQGNIEGVLGEIVRVQNVHPGWHLYPIVVNDGSTDQTQEVLERNRKHLEMAVIHLPINLGIGATVQTGFKKATQWGADVVIQLDGDGQHPPHQLPLLIAPILKGEAEVVIGSRYAEGAGGNVSSWLREIGTRFFSLLLRVLIGIRITDATSGFRAFSGDAAEFLSRYYPDDYPEVEAYVPLARRKFSIREVGVTMRPREKGQSSIRIFESVYYMIKVALATLIGMIRPIPRRRGESS